MGMSDFNRSIIEEFRANKGKVGGPFEGATLLILTTRGARTGKTLENPLVCIRDGERYIIIASYAGAPNNPSWFYNLKAHPVVTVEVGIEKFEARAEVLAEPERGMLYARMADVMPAFNDYQAKTSRTIPVIALTPAGAKTPGVSP